MRPVLNPGELARYEDMIVTGCLDFRRGEDLVIRAEPEHREAGSGAPAPRARAPCAPARCSHPPRAAAAYDGAIRYVDTGDFLQPSSWASAGTSTVENAAAAPASEIASSSSAVSPLVPIAPTTWPPRRASWVFPAS